MTPQEHKDLHIELHQKLDELVADFIRHTDALPSRNTILELIRWSARQTLEPTEDPQCSKPLQPPAC